MPGPYDAAYFRGRADGYSDYRRDIYPEDSPLHFLAQTDTLIGRALAKGFNVVGRKVLVVGCAFGYSLEYMLAAGADPWGVDISEYAISQAPASVASRVMQGDARLRDVLNAAKALAGLRSNQRFDLIVSEDLLPCFSDAEATAAATEWRRHTQQVMHRITIGQYEGGYNLRTLAQWRALLGPQDWIYDYVSWQEG